jgi:hypothetical protein
MAISDLLNNNRWGNISIIDEFYEQIRKFKFSAKCEE